MGKIKVLLIDDDRILLYLIDQVLTQSGYQVFTASNGPAGLELFHLHQPDLIILDLMMPEMSGWEVCRQIRRSSGVPIILLTALDGENHIIRGLDESSADYYVTKPFNPKILVARIEALLRRAPWTPEKTAVPVIYQDGYLTIDMVSRQVRVAAQPVRLSPIEYRLLAFLLQNANRVLSLEEILVQVWGQQYFDTPEYVHAYVSRLRQKIEKDPKNPRYLLSQHGVGYQFQFPLDLPAD